MKTARFALGSCLLLACSASVSLAQNQRTFVSGLGNDVIPCSRTAPCRTFGFAIGQTNAGGEVVALDSAGYGPFIISKPITVEASPGAYAGITVFSGDGILVSAGPSDVVILRGITLNSQGGTHGIDFGSAGVLHVESCVINGFSGDGISLSGPAQYYVKDTIIRNNTGSGIEVSGPSASVSIDHVRIEGNGGGVFVREGGKASISNSVLSGNVAQALEALASGSGTMAELNVESCRVANNGTGVFASGAGGGVGTIRLSNSTVTDNGTGVQQAVTGVLLSRTNNTIEGNTVADAMGTIGPYTAK
jgi:hypothetical protein